MTRDPSRAAATYKAIAVMFSNPSERSLGAIRAALGEEVRLEDLQEAHQAVFGGALPGVLPPLETEYDQANVFAKVQALADLAGFYRAFGLEVGEAAYRPDHLAVELEFAHVLATKEATAMAMDQEGRADLCRQALRDFLAEHLGAWGVPYLRGVMAEPSAGPGADADLRYEGWGVGPPRIGP